MSARANAAIVAVALAFGIGGFAASRWLFGPATEPAKRGDSAEVGDAAPDVVLEDLDGRRRSLGEWRGRTVLVNFWATWCAPCVREMPLLDAKAREEPAIAIVGIALDERASVRRFADELAIGYTLLLDTPGPSDSSVALGNTRGVLPYSVLLGPDGTILAQEIGDFADRAELEAFLARSNAR